MTREVSIVKEFLVYKITNTVNGKLYFGKSSNAAPDRWKKHLEIAKNKYHNII
jgi:predicted GIY-YIG superfamily endonuclease